MTELERQDTKMATLFELRLFLLNNEKKEYTLEEILDLLDKIGMVKDQKKQKNSPEKSGVFLCPLCEFPHFPKRAYGSNSTDNKCLALTENLFNLFDHEFHPLSSRYA